MSKLQSKSAQVLSMLTDELHPDRWADIASLRREARSKRIIDRDDPEQIEVALDFFEGAMIRRAMQRKDDDGFPLFPSIVVPEKDGEKTKRLYISRRSMKPLHYRQFNSECHRNALYWMGLENASVRECNSRYHTQLEIPWPEIDGAAAA